MAEDKSVKYLTAQVDEEYFYRVKSKLLERKLPMRDAIIIALNRYLKMGGDDIGLSTRASSEGDET